MPGQPVHDLKAPGRAVRHADGDRPVQLDDRRRRQVAEHHVQRGDALPVGRLHRVGLRVAGGDLGLHLVRARRSAECPGLDQGVQPVPDEQPVPPPPVLVGEQHRLAGRVGAGADPRGLQFHQRDQPVRLGLARHQPGQDPAEPHRLGAQRRPHPVLARRGRVALVEHQVDDLEDRGQAARDLGPRRELERHPPGGQGALGPHDALGDGGLGDQEGPGDLGGGQPAEQPQGEGGARLGRQHRMAGDEDQPQQVIADVIIHRVHVRLPGILRPQRHVAADFL